MKKKNQPQPAPDLTLLLIAAVLVLLGSVMVFSASVIMAEIRFQAPYVFAVKHFVWVLIGAAALFFFAAFDYRKLQKFARPLLVVSAVLLVLVLIVGTEKGGARRWFRWSFISFQPSELAKLAVIMGVADYLDRKKSRLKHWKGLIPALVFMGVICALIAVQPDLGTPITIFTVGLCMLYIAGARLQHLLALGAAAVPVVVIEILRRPYRLERFKSFLASWGGIDSVSYQLNQSLLALGSGGFFGKGLAQSQLKLFYLPEPHTDFIFPIIGEELGFVGTVFIILLFGAFAWRGWRIARDSSDYFGGMLALGITLLIVLQAFFNMGVACGILPTKGLPLPFVSFGGTALLINMAEVGILLSISKRSHK